MSKLMMHAGGWEATREEVEAVPVPERTRTYTPLPHAQVLAQVLRVLPEHGMELERSSFGLANEGARFFAVLDVRNGTNAPDWGMAIGIRNSYDRAFSLNLCAGSRVFVCDNLAFHGEVMLKRRHVGTVDSELPALVDGLVGEVADYRGEVAAQVDALKGAEIGDPFAHDFVVRALRAGHITSAMVPGIVEEWHKPAHPEFEPRTAWSLFNAFTEVTKRNSPANQFSRTLQLNRLFNREFAPSTN